MGSSTQADAGTDRSQVAAVRKAWIEAVVGSDVDRLAALATDDLVAVHGNGRCACGKQELRRDLLEAFERVDIERVALSSQVSVHDGWAIEIDDVEGTRLLDGEVAPITTRFTAVFVFRRQPDHSWKVARVMELPG